MKAFRPDDGRDSRPRTTEPEPPELEQNGHHYDEPVTEEVESRISGDLESETLRDVLRDMAHGINSGTLTTDSLLDMRSGVELKLAVNVLEPDELRYALFALLLRHYRAGKTEEEFQRWIGGLGRG